MCLCGCRLCWVTTLQLAPVFLLAALCFVFCISMVLDADYNTVVLLFYLFCFWSAQYCAADGGKKVGQFKLRIRVSPEVISQGPQVFSARLTLFLHEDYSYFYPKKLLHKNNRACNDQPIEPHWGFFFSSRSFASYIFIQSLFACLQL